MIELGIAEMVNMETNSKIQSSLVEQQEKTQKEIKVLLTILGTTNHYMFMYSIHLCCQN